MLQQPVYHFVCRTHKKHVSVHWQQGGWQWWVICLMGWRPVRTGNPRISRDTFRHPLRWTARRSLDHNPYVRNGLVPTAGRHRWVRTARNVSLWDFLHLSLAYKSLPGLHMSCSIFRQTIRNYVIIYDGHGFLSSAKMGVNFQHHLKFEKW